MKNFSVYEALEVRGTSGRGEMKGDASEMNCNFRALENNFKQPGVFQYCHFVVCRNMLSSTQ